MRVSRPTFPIARILLQEYSEDSAYQPSNKFGILRFFDILRQYKTRRRGGRTATRRGYKLLKMSKLVARL